ncbi:hypothetical protein SDC9_211310 [bioreactor metagenome]|uniref:Uncharacterized protein n=1 Tax=bioreactor metagenome TaxID=1076179 RepID=A0A645JJD5_9ZZZZ
MAAGGGDQRRKGIQILVAVDVVNVTALAGGEDFHRLVEIGVAHPMPDDILPGIFFELVLFRFGKYRYFHD